MAFSSSSFARPATLGELLRAKLNGESVSHSDDLPFVAMDYLYAGMEDAANEYIKRRANDAAQLAAEIKWLPRMSGVLRCEIYGQSILWDVGGAALHAIEQSHYEIVDLKRLHTEDADPTVVFSFNQILAYLLARFW